MPRPRSSTNESATLPPINILFAEVLQRQLTLPSQSQAVRRPSAWPGLPGPDKDVLRNTGYHHASPPPPLKVGRRSGAPHRSDLLSSPSIFPGTLAWDPDMDRPTTITPNSHRTSGRYAEAQERELPNLRDDRDNYRHPSAHPYPAAPGWSRFASDRLQTRTAIEGESGVSYISNFTAQRIKDHLSH
ncbi:hypothetical protein B0H10DRAFT_698064 [Mycena sp. CBHHK59/15]|nr:hypothetical protein B0H10DRAFT_698064 [Mycena sp. CBHHK59/15]